MKIFVNEIELSLAPGTTVGALRDQYKAEADVLIVNGFPAARNNFV